MKKILITFSLLLSIFFAYNIGAETVFAVENNIRINGESGGNNEGENIKELEKLTNFKNNNFFSSGKTGEQGIVNTLIQLARDIKNLFYIFATVFFLYISLRLILSPNTDEDFGKFRKGVLWITAGLILMQMSYAFFIALYDKNITGNLGYMLFKGIIYPLIKLAQTLASIFFIAMAIFAFYKLITANGNEDAVKSGRMTIVYALIGFLIVRFAQAIVEAFYGKISCSNSYAKFISTGENSCSNTLDISKGAEIIIQIINWLNSFVALIVLVMIIYAGVQILLSGGDEERLKTGRKSLMYIAIGVVLLMLNYLILTFFLIHEKTI